MPFALRKHPYIILTPLNPHFYIVKLGFTRVYIIFLISALWVLVRTAIYALSINMKSIRIFYLKNFMFFFSFFLGGGGGGGGRGKFFCIFE